MKHNFSTYNIRTADTTETLKMGKVFKQVVYWDTPRGYLFYMNHTRYPTSIDQTCPDLQTQPVIHFLHH